MARFMADLKYLNLSFNRFNAMDHVSYGLHIGSSILLSIEFKQLTKKNSNKSIH